MGYYIGTSGYSHANWKGIFYPEKISQKKMLEYYSRRFAMTEVNYTFRQLPARNVVENWATQVPPTFKFVLKAQQLITHVKRLQNAEQATDAFLDVASALGEKQGPILFQMPPSFKKDIPRLDAFLNHIAGRAKVAFEFRSETWFGQELVDCLRTHSAALVATQGDDLPESGIIPTTDWAYLRLRSAEYSDDQLREWLQQIREHNFANSYTVFMHEETGIGPKQGLRFMELAREAGLLSGVI